MFNPRHYYMNGIHFLWFTWINKKHYSIYWECNPPIWWKPKIEKEHGALRIGWLWFAVGFSWELPNENEVS